MAGPKATPHKRACRDCGEPFMATTMDVCPFCHGFATVVFWAIMGALAPDITAHPEPIPEPAPRRTRGQRGRGRRRALFCSHRKEIQPCPEAAPA
jgi:hypothetical protein